MHKILILNGPNLNMLGTREVHHYGSQTLEEINSKLNNIAIDNNCDIEFFQSNHEGDIIDKIHSVVKNVDFILINPAGYTHTSVAIRDALILSKIPFIEIHISNIFTREPFRHTSLLSDIAISVISGLGVYGYECALRYAIKYTHRL